MKNLKFASPVFLTIAGILGSAGTQEAAAQQAQQGPCAVRDKQGTVAVVICDPGLGQEQWKQAAEAACANVPGCSAWIWDDASKAPTSAPSLPTGIEQRHVLSSVAIWDNET